MLCFFSDVPVLERLFALWLAAVNMHLLLLREYNKYARGIISRIIPDVWSVVWSHGHQDTNQSKKDPHEGVTLLRQVAFSGILHKLVLTSPEMSIQVQQVVLATAQTPPCSAKR